MASIPACLASATVSAQGTLSGIGSLSDSSCAERRCVKSVSGPRPVGVSSEYLGAQAVPFRAGLRAQRIIRGSIPDRGNILSNLLRDRARSGACNGRAPPRQVAILPIVLDSDGDLSAFSARSRAGEAFTSTGLSERCRSLSCNAAARYGNALRAALAAPRGVPSPRPSRGSSCQFGKAPHALRKECFDIHLGAPPPETRNRRRSGQFSIGPSSVAFFWAQTAKPASRIPAGDWQLRGAPRLQSSCKRRAAETHAVRRGGHPRRPRSAGTKILGLRARFPEGPGKSATHRSADIMPPFSAALKASWLRRRPKG